MCLPALFIAPPINSLGNPFEEGVDRIFHQSVERLEIKISSYTQAFKALQPSSIDIHP